jgi:tmRNA-binding protein
VQHGELWLHNLHIAEYQAAGHFNTADPCASCDHKKDEIARLAGRAGQRGDADRDPALRRRGRAKVSWRWEGQEELRQAGGIAERDAQRAIQQALRQHKVDGRYRLRCHCPDAAATWTHFASLPNSGSRICGA